MKTNLPPSIKFLIAIFVQLAIVFGLVVFNAAVLARGTEILLPIEPFDPQDPLRGDYVLLQYEISSIEEDFFGDKRNGLKENDLIYVSLGKKDNYWIAKGASVQKPKEGLFIKGNVGYLYSRVGGIPVKYGIEEYFIPEGTGAALEEKIRARQAFAKVVVDKNGKAILKDIVFEEGH